ncbi:MAG TPA: tetratricopeptide repeat protein [Vicinamibacterales bacterium]|nr:tetratricopeptide repeat protein [Vicinamibacterales bacterium]
MLAAVLLTIAAAAVAQDVPPEKLFEAGKYQEVIDSVRSRPDAPQGHVYLRALAHRKLDQNDDAKQAFGSLATADEGSAWREIGNSGTALVEGNLDAAQAAARKAVEIDANSAQAHFQLGLVESARDDHAQAAEAFARAAELDPQMAYAHYEAGMSFYKTKRIDRMAVYFENFLRLAPEAPERPAVQSIMRTVRGR